MNEFKDHFSKHADAYARFRPGYPQELFAYLSSLTPDHLLAWDCGTGNGQSAIQLVEFFDQVYASDPSPQQLKNAFKHERIAYRSEPAEAPLALEDHSVDMITVAQALHWFEFDAFYFQVKRVLKSKGVIAAWAYGLPQINPAIDQLLREFHDDTVGAFWLAENKMIDANYSSIPFPFEEVLAPDFYITQYASLFELMGHVSTWSATQKYILQHRENPVNALTEKLMEHWLDSPEIKKKITWKLILKIGKLHIE